MSRSSTLRIFWKKFFFAQTHFADVLDDSEHDERKKNFLNFWNFCSTLWRFFDKMSSTDSKDFYMSGLSISRWSFSAQNQLKRMSQSTSMAKKLTHTFRHLSRCSACGITSKKSDPTRIGQKCHSRIRHALKPIPTHFKPILRGSTFFELTPHA